MSSPPGPGSNPDNPYANNPYANNPYAKQPFGQQQSPQAPPPQAPPPPAPQAPPPQQPYGAPQSGPPGYGYPQTPPGYPQAPPLAPTGWGGPPPGVMPSQVNASRWIMFIAGGLQALFSLLGVVLIGVLRSHLSTLDPSYSDARIGTAVMYVLLAVFVLHGVVGIVLGTLVSKGGSGVRVGAIVWASFLILFGLVAIPLGLLWIGCGVATIVMLAQSPAGNWFQRPRS